MPRNACIPRALFFVYATYATGTLLFYDVFIFDSLVLKRYNNIRQKTIDKWGINYEDRLCKRNQEQ